jgi:hypothetical protein
VIDNKDFDPSSILIICHIVVTVIGNGSGLRYCKSSNSCMVCLCSSYIVKKINGI